MARQRWHVCVRVERADKMNISIIGHPILYPRTPLARSPSPRKRLPLPQAQSESESSAPTDCNGGVVYRVFKSLIVIFMVLMIMTMI